MAKISLPTDVGNSYHSSALKWLQLMVNRFHPIFASAVRAIMRSTQICRFWASIVIISFDFSLPRESTVVFSCLLCVLSGGGLFIRLIFAMKLSWTGALDISARCAESAMTQFILARFALHETRAELLLNSIIKSNALFHRSHS